MNSAGGNGPAAPAFHGLCLVEIERVKAAEERFGARFLSRVFTPAELAYCGSGAARLQRLAARFAAKAAVRAALRQAGLPPIPYRLLEVARDEWGMPHLVLHEPIASEARILVSLSHSRILAVACTVLVEGGVGAGG